MRETILEMYFKKQMKPIDISKQLSVSKSTITRILQKDERYAQEKELRKDNNRIKHIKETKALIKKQRKLKQFKHKSDDLILKVMHEQAVTELSKHNKLSDLAYRKWNISAYKYDIDKRRFIFREELGRSADVPKYIKVEV